MTNETKHTPGPWCLDGFNTSSVIKCVTHKGHHDAKHLSGDYVNIARCDGENWKANAHLIAAAPELYEVLSEAMERGGLIQMCLYDKARAALAKARGESL